VVASLVHQTVVLTEYRGKGVLRGGSNWEQRCEVLWLTAGKKPGSKRGVTEETVVKSVDERCGSSTVVVVVVVSSSSVGSSSGRVKYSPLSV